MTISASFDALTGAFVYCRGRFFRYDSGVQWLWLLLARFFSPRSLLMMRRSTKLD